MMFLALVFPLLQVATALPSKALASAAKPPYFILAGDSTTAVQSSGGGGWGVGFLNTTLRAPASGIDLGHNGATTVSFRAGGDWDNVLSIATERRDENEVFVTIQFGHNDQKPAANISLAQYSANLATLVSDVRAVNATPILITPLTRRSFTGSPPRIIQSLANERNATISVAQQTDSRWIDLNLASERYCNAIGPDASWKYNLNPDDTTHLNAWGSVVFGRLVSDLLVEKYEDIRKWTVWNETLSRELEEGVPA